MDPTPATFKLQVVWDQDGTPVKGLRLGLKTQYEIIAAFFSASRDSVGWQDLKKLPREITFYGDTSGMSPPLLGREL